MSDSALTLLRMRFFVLELMERSRRSPAADRLLFDLEFNLRLQAAFVIGFSCPEPASGPSLRGTRAGSAAVSRGFSAACDGGGFCQAGVVAPPDSLTDEKTPSTPPALSGAC